MSFYVLSTYFARLGIPPDLLENYPKKECLRAGKLFSVKEEQGIPFSTTKIPLMWTPHSNNVKHANVLKPGNR